MSRKIKMTNKDLLAAELFSYSYDNYNDRLGIGNARFDEMMPADVDIPEAAEREEWEAARLAEALEIPEEDVADYQEKYQHAKEIIDAPTLAESFRRGVRYSILYALEEGFGDKASVERLVTQICCRAADLSFRLDMEGRLLSEFSEELRKESRYDDN